MNLAKNISHMSGHCCRGFQDQRSKVKVKTGQLTFNGRGIHFDSVVSTITCFL